MVHFLVEIVRQSEDNRHEQSTMLFRRTFLVSLNSSLLKSGATVFKYFFAVSANVGTGNLKRNR